MSEEFLLTLRITSTKVPVLPCRYTCIVIVVFFSEGLEINLYDLQAVVKWYCTSDKHSKTIFFVNGEFNCLTQEETFLIITCSESHP